MRRSLYIALLLGVICMTAQTYSLADNVYSSKAIVSAGSGASSSSVSLPIRLRELSPLRKTGLVWQRQKSGCKQRELEITGTYNGVLFIDKNQKEGKPAKIIIQGNSFELTSDSFTGKGLISASKICDDTSIALKFTQAKALNNIDFESFLSSGISLDARVVGTGTPRVSAIDELTSANAIVLSTTRDQAGNFAGPDIGFVICPDYPRCRRYPTCPCVSP